MDAGHEVAADDEGRSEDVGVVGEERGRAVAALGEAERCPRGGRGDRAEVGIHPAHEVGRHEPVEPLAAVDGVRALAVGVGTPELAHEHDDHGRDGAAGDQRVKAARDADPVPPGPGTVRNLVDDRIASRAGIVAGRQVDIDPDRAPDAARPRRGEADRHQAAMAARAGRCPGARRRHRAGSDQGRGQGSCNEIRRVAGRGARRGCPGSRGHRLCSRGHRLCRRGGRRHRLDRRGRWRQTLGDRFTRCRRARHRRRSPRPGTRRNGYGHRERCHGYPGDEPTREHGTPCRGGRNPRHTSLPQWTGPKTPRLTIRPATSSSIVGSSWVAASHEWPSGVGMIAMGTPAPWRTPANFSIWGP